MTVTIKQLALSLGFDACGIARAEALTEDAAFLRQWLASGMQGDMHYLERNFDKRTDPRMLVPGCKSVVVVLMNYYPSQKQNPVAPQIAKYAYAATDYHLVLKTKLFELEQKICETYGTESVNTNVQHSFVDSAPVLERRWAERAGLGWIGRHTQLIHPGLGSYTFIGILMLNIETEYDMPVMARCGTCMRCIDACPTNALQNGSLDARRCISYLTIESKDEIPPEFKAVLSGNALGCDICADVCPWNARWAKPYSQDGLSPIDKVLEWGTDTWKQLTEKEFAQTFSHSAIKRVGYTKLRQNIEAVTKAHRLQ
ncbi:MAG: tRNA epoxyqueuosine(34) reductase QueG [Bacteroidota bacterium]|nr:tRNA epoxyqueuosine(34) reductase QueG [Bacteroidota bacterium]